MERQIAVTPTIEVFGNGKVITSSVGLVHLRAAKAEAGRLVLIARRGGQDFFAEQVLEDGRARFQ